MMMVLETGIPWEDCPVEVGKLYRYSEPPMSVVSIFHKDGSFSFPFASEVAFFVLENTYSKLHFHFHNPISADNPHAQEHLLAVRCLMGEEECFLCFEGSQTRCPGAFTEVTDVDL